MTEYERIQRVFEQVVDLPPERRREEVRRVVHGDDALEASVLAMLEDLDRASAAAFLGRPVLGGKILLDDRTELRGGPMPHTPGYSLKEPLGSGSCGTVFRAIADPPLGREVAVKVLRSGLPTSARVRFQREQRALARLNHPGVAQIYDAGETVDGRPFVAVELIDGPWITTYAETNHLDWRSRVELMIEVCEAVHAIHTNGLLHRDLKPANILVARADGKARPKVIDFGASAALEPAAAVETHGPMLVGTLAYMAPEQLSGDTRVDARTDVHALGVVCHELLAGGHPFGAPEAPLGDLVRRIAEEPLPPLPESAGRDRRDLHAVLSMACAKDPSRRYASTQHLGDDLRRVLRRLPIDARSPSAMAQVRSIVRRHPWSVRFAAAATVAFTALGVALARSAYHNAAQADRMRSTLEVLVDDVLDKVSLLSGGAAASESLATLLLDRLESLPNDIASETTRRQRARVLGTLGGIALERGDVATAIRVRAEAVEILDALSESAPESRVIADEALIATIVLGDAYGAAGRSGDALALYEIAHRSILERLAAEPGDVRLRDELCWSYERLAGQIARSEPERALELRRSMLEVATGLHEDQPDALRLFGLGCAHSAVADCLRVLGRHAEGRPHSEEAVRLLAEASRIEPHRLTFRVREIIVRNGLVKLLIVTDPERATPMAHETLRLARRLTEANPESATTWSVRASTLWLAHEAALAVGRRDDADALRPELAAVDAEYNSRRPKFESTPTERPGH